MSVLCTKHRLCSVLSTYCCVLYRQGTGVQADWVMYAADTILHKIDTECFTKKTLSCAMTVIILLVKDSSVIFITNKSAVWAGVRFYFRKQPKGHLRVNYLWTVWWHVEELTILHVPLYKTFLVFYFVFVFVVCSVYANMISTKQIMDWLNQQISITDLSVTETDRLIGSPPEISQISSQNISHDEAILKINS